MSYELRRFMAHLKPQNYSNICEQNGIKNANKNKFVLSPGFLNEEFPALSVVPSKSCKQNPEHDISVDFEKSSYSEKLQAKNKSCNNVSYSLYKNDQHIKSKFNSRSPLNSIEHDRISDTAASSFYSGVYTKSYFKGNEKKECTDKISVARNVENSKQNHIYANFSYSFVEKEIVRGNQSVKVSDKATLTENIENNLKCDKIFHDEIRKTSQKQNVPLQNINYPSRSKFHNSVNIRNSFKYSKQNKVKDFDTNSSHSEQNSEKTVNKNLYSRENNIQSMCKNVDISHIKKEPGLMDESLGTGSSTNTTVVGKKSGRKRKTRKRSNKIKRQTVFQTGKLLILTPDLHSRITKSLSKCDSKPSSNAIVDIDNFDEYPTLGSQSDGTKEIFLQKTLSSLADFHLKTEIKVQTNVDFSVVPESDQLVNSESKTTAKSFLGNWPSSTSNGDVDSNLLEGKEIGKMKDIKKLELVAEKKLCPRQTIQLLDLLTVSKQKGKAKKTIEVTPKHYVAKSNVISHGLNVLDSSAPNIKRGKEREKPKQKKLSSLKKIILSERLRKKEVKEQRKKECLLALYAATKDNFVDSTFGNSNTYMNSTEDNLRVDHSSNTETSEFEDIIKIEKIKETDNKVNLMKAEKNEIIVKAEEHKLSESCEKNDKYFEDKRNLIVQAFIHVKGFREYCNHLLSKELNETTILFIDCLARFQDRQHQKDPVKARMKRRLTYGLKEVTKHLKLRKLKCVVIAPDLEDIQSSGGLNSALAVIIQIAADYHIPCIFAANRKQLGKACHKAVPVSCVGVFSYEGSESLYKKTSELHEKCLKDYQYLKKTIFDNLTNENIEEFMLAKENGSIVVMRCKFLKDILSKEIEDLELLEKYNSDIYAWFRDHYLLKLSEVV